MIQKLFAGFASLTLVLLVNSTSLAQSDSSFTAVVENLRFRGATVERVKKGNALKVNLFDCLLLHDSILEVKKLKGPKTVLIGNTLANLPIESFADALVECPDVKTVILDSVDFTPKLLGDLKKKMPDTRFVLSERAAITCINKSYRFAFGGKQSSAFRLEIVGENNPAEFDKQYFLAANYFIGREMLEGGWRKPLGRRAVEYFRHLRGLKGACLSGIPIIDDDLINLSQAKSLEFLNLDSTSIDGSGLNDLRAKHLKALVLTNNALLKSIPFEKFPQLELLLVSQSGIEIRALKEVSNCRNLTKLEMAGIDCSTRDLVEILKSNPLLRELIICQENVSIQEGVSIIGVRAKFPNTKIRLVPVGFSREEHLN